MIIFKLDELLDKKHKTRYWLSKKTGLDFSTVNRIMNNEITSIHLNTIEIICAALECDISDLMELSS